MSIELKSQVKLESSEKIQFRFMVEKNPFFRKHKRSGTDGLAMKSQEFINPNFVATMLKFLIFLPH